MADYTVDEVHDRVRDALAAAVGEVVTGWTLVIDTITDEGTPATWWLVQDDQPIILTLGHVRYVDHKIAAALAGGGAE